MLARPPEVVTALPAIFAWNLFLGGIIDHFKDRALPDVLTRASLSHITLDMQKRALTSLRALKLIDENGKTRHDFKKLIESRNTGQWQVQLRLLMQTRYPYIPPHTLGQMTSEALHTAFKAHVKRDTANLSKAEIFFLNLARAGGVQLSAELQKRVATADTMATVRAARKDLAPQPAAKKDSAVKPETQKPAMSKQERVEKIMDILRMFSGEGLPAEQLAALLCLWDYAKKTAEAE